MDALGTYKRFYDTMTEYKPFFDMIESRSHGDLMAFADYCMSHHATIRRIKHRGRNYDVLQR